MNRDKAKERLRLHPPGANADDDELRQARAKLEENPELKAWYERERAFDRRVARTLKTLPVPPDLRNEILATRKAPVIPFPRLRPAAAAAAALLLLAAGWAFFAASEPVNAPPPARASTDFLGDLVTFLEREPDFDHFDTNFAALRERVRAAGGPVARTVPASLEEMPGYRCRVFKQEARQVALICMQREDTTLHLFVVDENAGRESGPGPSRPQFTETGGWAFANWDDGDKTCVLATRGSKEKLEPLF